MMTNKEDKSAGERNDKAFAFWRNTLRGARVCVAPMVDQSELAWRILSRRYGAELCYTPMLHASVFIRDATYRKENLASCDFDRPLIVQFAANDPETLIKACLLAAPHCDAVDLNLGCPQSIARRGNYGAFLQDDWERVFRLVNAVHLSSCPVPITCKIRVFEDMDKTVKYAQMIESAGCQLLTVHGRTRDQKGPNTGLASWPHVAAVKRAVRIPVFANGNIQYFEDVEHCLEATGAEGVMSAEGNLHNPCLFQNKHLPCWKVGLEYLDLVEEHPCNISTVRAHIFKLFHHSAQRYDDIQMSLATANKLEQFRSNCATLRDRCLESHEKYERDPSSIELDNLPFPHWICQPYFRPTTDELSLESEQQKEKRAMERKRKHDALSERAQKSGISKRQLRRLERGGKAVERPKRALYIQCSCGNPISQSCVFRVCRKCCINKSKESASNCPVHNIWFGDKNEKELFRNKKNVSVVQP